MENLHGLIDVLGKKNAERLRDSITDLIIDRIQEDLNNWNEFIFYPPDYKDFFESCFEAATKRVKKQLIEKMTTQMLEAGDIANNTRKEGDNEKVP